MAEKEFRIIRFKQAFIPSQVDELRRLINISESAVHGHFANSDKAIEAQTTGLNEEERREYYDSISDEHFVLADSIPQWVRRGMLLAIYGTFEHILVDLAHTADSDGLTTAPLSKKKQSGVSITQQAHDHLINNARLAPSDFGTHWDFLDCSRRIRNSVAHGDSHVRLSDVKRLTVYGANLISVDVDFGVVKIGKDFCEHLIDAVDNCLISVATALNLKA